VYASLDAKNRDEKLPLANITDHDTLFAQPLETLLQQHFKEAESLEPAIKAFVDDQVRDGQDFILEGLHLMPNLMRNLAAKAEVRALVLVSEATPETLVPAIKNNQAKHDWLRGKKKETYFAVATFVAAFSHQLAEQAATAGISMMEMDGDFPTGVDEAGKILEVADD
jgi:2-phosphoglycerate kinase